jgi:FKBP-type peptidyl-prolyl cis-trans isomerase FkpA
MKQIIFTLFILTALALSSCRKNGGDINIKQYDQQQITNFISSNHLTNMVKDTSGGDTTGIYYQLMSAGNTSEPALDYPDSVSFVYTLATFDQKFEAQDTAVNHYAGFVGHIVPNGLMLSVRNILKHRGAKARVLIPSHLGFGLAGAGSGSKTITNGRIAGNQCLDYYVYVVDNQSGYDDIVIKNYMAHYNLTGYTEIANGVYYKITVPGTGISPITENSSITCTYTGYLMNGVIFDENIASTGSASFNIPDLTLGVAEALQRATAGADISIIVPSRMAYGSAGSSGSLATVPSNACLRFDFSIATVTP